MNRQQRRRLRAPAAMRAIVAAYRCPDCDSEAGEPWPDHDAGIWRMEIRHDDTCPWYRRYIEGAGTRGVS